VASKKSQVWLHSGAQLGFCQGGGGLKNGKILMTYFRGGNLMTSPK